jgi:hypothetical protein
MFLLNTRRRSRRQINPQVACLSVSFQTIGGVYATAYDAPFSTSWISSGSSNHHDDAPLRVKKSPSGRSFRSEDDERIHLGDREVMGRSMLNSHKLPKSSGCYANNHVMINVERVKRYVSPLMRVPSLDELAKEQAILMAASKELSRSDPVGLGDRIRDRSRRLGVNVVSGSNLHDIHSKMMKKSLADMNNILDRRFVSMGVGTAKSADGKLYVCQIFPRVSEETVSTISTNQSNIFVINKSFYNIHATSYSVPFTCISEAAKISRTRPCTMKCL